MFSSRKRFYIDEMFPFHIDSELQTVEIYIYVTTKNKQLYD
jgi:hypothetical protein